MPDQEARRGLRAQLDADVEGMLDSGGEIGVRAVGGHAFTIPLAWRWPGEAAQQCDARTWQNDGFLPTWWVKPAWLLKFRRFDSLRLHQYTL